MKAECDVPVPGIPGTGNFSFFWWYRNRYRKKLVPEKSLGTGIGKIWYRKKVPEPVSEKFGTGKSLGTGIGKIWYWKKSRSWNQYYLIQKKFSTHLAIFFVPVSINHSMKAFSLCILYLSNHVILIFLPGIFFEFNVNSLCS